MPNNRIFYACHSVALGDQDVIQGVQSVGVNTNFNLEQIFQLGRLEIYDQVPQNPEVEVTINKVLDGYASIYNLATGGGTIISNANDQHTITLGVGDDTAAAIVSNIAAIEMTGCYINSLNYTFPVDGNFTEEVSFVGSHKATGGTSLSPANVQPDVNVLRRQNFKYNSCTLPSSIDGARLSQVSISTDFNREPMFALGQLAAFHRFVNFPIEITVTFDVISDGNAVGSRDLVGPDFDEITAECQGLDIDRESIFIQLCDNNGANTYSFDLGSGCRLASVSYSGGDTGGGNVTETYTYSTFNTLEITG